MARADTLAISSSASCLTRSNLIGPGAGQAARASDAVLACSAVAAELVVPTAFLVAAVLFAIRAVSKHSDSDAQAYLARPPDAAPRSDGSRSDLVSLQLRVRPRHPTR